MTILFFDTETTGFTREGSAPTHPDQPYVVQLACQLTDDAGDILGGFSFIVKQVGPIPPQAAAVHGISDEVAAKFGVEPGFAMRAFEHLLARADLVVAHNIRFDKLVVEAAMSRHSGQLWMLDKPRFCTMEAATPICNLPPTERMMAAGRKGPKAPKLEEAVRHFFDEPLDGAHDAMVDVIACRRVFFALKEGGYVQ